MADPTFTPSIQDYLNQVDSDIAARAQPSPVPSTPAITPSPAQTVTGLDDKDAAKVYSAQIDADIAARKPPAPPVDDAQAFKNDALRPVSNWSGLFGALGAADAYGYGATNPITTQAMLDPGATTATMNREMGVDKDASYSNPLYAAAGGAVNGAMNSVPLLPFAGPAALGWGALAGGTNAGVTDLTGSPTAGLAASLIAPFGGGLLKGGINAVTRDIPPVVGQPLIDAGITPNAAITKGIQAQDEFATTPMGQYQPLAQNVADAYGPTASKIDIGNNVRDQALAYIDRQGQEASQRFGQFEQMIPKDTVSPGATDDLLAHLGLSRQTSDPITRYNPDGSIASQSSTSSLVDAAPNGPAGFNRPPVLDELAGYLKQNFPDGDIPYGTLKSIRTDIGARINNDLVNNGGVYNADMKQLYGKLSDAMESTISQTGGQPALDAFHANNAAYSQAQDFIANSVAKLADEGLTPEAVAGKLLNPEKSGSTLQDLYQQGVLQRGDLDILARQQFNRLGQNSDGLWDPVTFTKNVTKLNQNAPEAAQLLFRTGVAPETRSAFDNLVSNSKLLYDSVASPFAKANANSEGGTVGKLLGKTALIVGTAGAGHLVGGEAGSVLGGVLSESMMNNGATAGNALYRIAQEPWANRVLTKLVPNTTKAAATIMAQAKFHPAAAQDLQTLSNAITGQPTQEASGQ